MPPRESFAWRHQGFLSGLNLHTIRLKVLQIARPGNAVRERDWSALARCLSGKTKVLSQGLIMDDNLRSNRAPIKKNGRRRLTFGSQSEFRI